MSASCTPCSFKVWSKDEGCLYKNFVVVLCCFDFYSLAPLPNWGLVIRCQVARSSWLLAVGSLACLAPSWSPALSKAMFESRLCSVAWGESSHNGSAAALLPSCATLPSVGHLVLINEALVWAGKLFLTLSLPPHPLCGSFLKTWWYQCYELEVGQSGVVESSNFSLLCVNLCKLHEPLNWIHTWTHLLLMPSHPLK